MGLPRPLDELIEIARRDQTVSASDLRQILGEVQRLQDIDREQLMGKAKDWKQRLGRLDMMAFEMIDTPGAEALLAKAEAANIAINELDSALDLAASGVVCPEPEEPVAEPKEPRPIGFWRAEGWGRECYHVPMGGSRQREWLAAIVPVGFQWSWCRYHSKRPNWAGGVFGVADSREQAEERVLEGWGAEA